MNMSDNTNNQFDDDFMERVQNSSTNFDSACHFDSYVENKQPAFEGWFDDDKLIKIKVDGKVIDFSQKKNTFDIIDRAVNKLIDFKYKF